MRARFTNQLGEIEQRLLAELDGIGRTLETVADTLLDPSVGSAELGEASIRLRQVSRHADEQLVAVTAQQAPVAADLRRVLCLVQLAPPASLIANQFELIGEQLAHVDPAADDPQQTAKQLSLMTELAGRQMRHATRVFATRDADSAAELE